MRNELLGFLQDHVIDGLFHILQKLGSKNRDSFQWGDFQNLYSENYPEYTTEEVKIFSIRCLMLVMWEC